MIEAIALDAGILGLVSHPRPHPALAQWFATVLRSRTEVLIPEIADFEVRRELLRAGKKTGVARLDRLKDAVGYLPITTTAMLQAARLWADARNRGRPTADPKELDCDVILAAQALQAGATVVTDNIGHLALFVDAKRWTDLEVR